MHFYKVKLSRRVKNRLALKTAFETIVFCDTKGKAAINFIKSECLKLFPEFEVLTIKKASKPNGKGKPGAGKTFH